MGANPTRRAIPNVQSMVPTNKVRYLMLYNAGSGSAGIIPVTGGFHELIVIMDDHAGFFASAA